MQAGALKNSTYVVLFPTEAAIWADRVVIFSVSCEAEQTGRVGLGECVVDQGDMVHGDGQCTGFTAVPPSWNPREQSFKETHCLVFWEEVEDGWPTGMAAGDTQG